MGESLYQKLRSRVLLSEHIYFFYLFVVESTWLVYMIWTGSWHLFKAYWPAAVTMVFGSFVAGATAEGGAFIAFPVFTKVLHLSSFQSSIFGLMIQSIGMTAATVLIVTLPVAVLYPVIRWARSQSMVLGSMRSAFFFQLEKMAILFSFK